MTPIVLLDELKKFIEENTKDIMLQVKTKREETKEERAVEVYKMNLPSKEAEVQQVPYIVLQYITGKDDQQEGQPQEAEARVRIVFGTYSEKEKNGSDDILNLITRVRIALLKAGVIGNQFILKKPLEYIVYPDNTPPYYFGEMMTIWAMPTIEREVQFYG